MGVNAQVPAESDQVDLSDAQTLDVLRGRRNARPENICVHIRVDLTVKENRRTVPADAVHESGKLLHVRRVGPVKARIQPCKLVRSELPFY